MKETIKSLIGDGEGNASMMRVIVFLVVAATIGTKIYNAWITKSTIVWDSTDLGMLGGPMLAKLIQNTQENKAPAQTKAENAP